MKRTPVATALRTRCAERIRAMQLVCICASYTCAVLFTEHLLLEKHEVHVWAYLAFMQIPAGSDHEKSFNKANPFLLY